MQGVCVIVATTVWKKEK